MNKLVLLVIIFTFFIGIYPQKICAEQSTEFTTDYKEHDKEEKSKKRIPLFHYGYNEREHGLFENVKNISIVYGMTWFLYPLIQPKILRGAGGIKNYSHNFGKIVFDQDEPFWNGFVHPLSGSQLYLLYRANGYDRLSAFEMTFISSSLFELTIEIFTEPASVQDLYQTPVLGTVLGFVIENASISLLNSGNPLGKFLGHILNPATLLPIYEGRMLIIPKIEDVDKGAMIKWEGQF
jgi:hypothetical protein